MQQYGSWFNTCIGNLILHSCTWIKECNTSLDEPSQLSCCICYSNSIGVVRFCSQSSATILMFTHVCHCCMCKIETISVIWMWWHLITHCKIKASQWIKAHSHEAHCDSLSMRIRSESNWMRIDRIHMAQQISRLEVNCGEHECHI